MNQLNLSADSIQILWSGVKILYLIGFALYTAFSVVVISQVNQMTHTINDKLAKQSILISWLHLALSLLAFGWAIVVL